MDTPTDAQLEHILAILGALVPLASALASFLNHLVREKQARGEAVSPALLTAGSVLNIASVNLDKAVQLGRMVKGGAAAPAPVAAAEPEPVAEAPKASEPPPVPEGATIIPKGTKLICKNCMKPVQL